MKRYIIAALALLMAFASCVKMESEVETINLGGSVFYIEVGSTMTINPVIIPETAKDALLTWTSHSPEIASVSGGVITAHKVGSAEIVVMAESGVTASFTVNVTPVVTGISLPTALTVYVGGTTVLTPTFSPIGANSTMLEWSSADPSVATVDQSGVVTGVNGGRTTVTVKCKDYVATCQIKVREAADNIQLDITEADLKVGVDVLQLTAIVEPSNALDYDLEWSSSDENVASVNEKGLVTPVGPGEAQITVTMDKAYEAFCTVRVTQPAEGVELNKYELSLQRGTTEQLIATVYPQTTNIKDLIWTSSDESVASVDAEGLVTANALGTAEITVKTVDGSHTAVCLVSVIQATTGVSLDLETATLKIGEGTLKLNAVVTPEDATNKSLIWTSSDPSVASVNEEGIVTPLAPGASDITVTTVDGGFTAVCKISVVQPVYSVVLSDSAININPGMAYQLIATINPSNATNKELEWSSSDPTVAVVDQNGVVTGVDSGVAGRETTITVRSKDSGVTAECIVRVTKDVVGVTLSHTNLRLEVGANFQLIASVIPSDATNKNVTWHSSNESVITVDAEGKLTAKAEGTAVITVTTNQNGYSATCTVKVRPKGTSDNEGFENEDNFGWN